MSENGSWKVTLHLREYAQARTLFQLGILLPHHSVLFEAFDADGAPMWTDEDEAALQRQLEAAE